MTKSIFYDIAEMTKVFMQETGTVLIENKSEITKVSIGD